jgi:HEAT repeat protein
MDVWSTRKSRCLGPVAWLAVAWLATCAGCSTYLGTTPKSFLRYVRSSPDPNIRFLAYAKLGSVEYDDPNDKSEAVETLVTKLDEGKEPKAIKAVIIHTLGELGDRRARNAIARVVNDPNTDDFIKVEAYRALGKVGKAEDAMTLVRLMNTERLEDCRIAAIEGIGALKAKDPRIYHILIEGMEHEDPAIRLQSYRALKQITGKDAGNRPAAWRKELQPELARAEKPAVSDAATTGAATIAPAQEAMKH